MTPPELAYVFWHRPRPGVRRADYEARLLAFQRSLTSHGPPGLKGAYCFKQDRLPWSSRRATAYEDWYLVDGFPALGYLNDAAVDSENKRPHDEAAEMSSVVAGGVYRLVRGGLPLEEVRAAAWIRKPAGTSYEEFYDSLSERMEGQRTRLWRRQMVLGPTAEFCLHAEDRLALSGVASGRPVRVQPLAGGGP